MSWFKRRPRLKEPSKPVTHHRSSPISEKLLEEAKKLGPKNKIPKNKSINKK